MWRIVATVILIGGGLYTELEIIPAFQAELISKWMSTWMNSEKLGNPGEMISGVFGDLEHMQTIGLFLSLLWPAIGVVLFFIWIGPLVRLIKGLWATADTRA
ncbi:hypothetical protein HYT05_03935 [Candidatus Kaiserbacteria bacterium]|nr:hypothetical protein [Candidatus Kaiserbacteria bacterium]